MDYCSSKLARKLGALGGPVRQSTNVYALMSGGDTPFIKFGMSKNIKNRLNTMQVGNPEELEVLGSVPGSAILERFIHECLKRWSKRGEWYHASPEVRYAAQLLVDKQYEDLNSHLEACYWSE